MKTKILFAILLSFFWEADISRAQNISINTTGATNSSLSMLEILQLSATANTKGLFVSHTGAIAGTGYGVLSEITGASTTNIAGYFNATGATNNYAMIVPNGGGRVGIGTSSPDRVLTIQGTGASSEMLSFKNTTGTTTWHINAFGGASNLNFAETFVEDGRLYLEAGGSIGIGTTTPVSKLDVEGGVSIGATYSGTTASPANGAIIEGNVGIGSTSPEAILEVQGVEATDAAIALDADDGDDNGDTWFLKSEAATNDFGLTNHTTKYLALTSDGRLYGAALHNNSGAVTGTTNQYIASGTYTPTLTNVAVITSSTAYQCQWMRVGNVVTVSGRVDINANGAGTVSLGMSLPVASNIATAQNLGGTFFSSANPTLSITEFVGTITAYSIDVTGGPVSGDITNDRASFNYYQNSGNTNSFYFTFTYVVL